MIDVKSYMTLGGSGSTRSARKCSGGPVIPAKALAHTCCSSRHAPTVTRDARFSVHDESKMTQSKLLVNDVSAGELEAEERETPRIVAVPVSPGVHTRLAVDKNCSAARNA
jgi:hypothetical protein